MYPWLNVGQILQWTLLEEQASVLTPRLPEGVDNTLVEGVAAEMGSVGVQKPAVAREDTSSAEWLAAETGAGGVTDAPSGMSPETAGTVLAVMGAVSSAIGAWSMARSEQSRLKSQALSMQHEATMSAINARAAEEEAQAIIAASHQDIGTLTLQAGYEEGARTATMAGRGVQLGVGSAAEVQASGRLMKEIDTMSIGVNAARSAAAARTRSVNFGNQSRLASVSARALRRSAGNDLVPVSAATTSLLTSGARLGAQWATDRRPYGYRP